MFGGDPNNLGFPLLLDDNTAFQYDRNALPQLQLFGNYPGGQNVGPLNYVRKNEPDIVGGPTKRFRDAETIARPQLYPTTMNVSTKGYKDEAGLSGSILNPVAVSTGLKLSYEEDEHNSSVTSVSETATAALPTVLSVGDGFKVEMDQQRKEIDQYIKAQEDMLIKGLRELRNRQTASLLSAIEKGFLKKLQEKDLELEMMNRKNRELEVKITRATSEVQSWQYRAKYNESAVNALRNNLWQVMARQGAMRGKEGCGDSEVDDAASYTNHDPSMDGIAGNKMTCKSCRVKEVAMLLLPCRHLCLCKECDAYSGACPLCHVTKTASVQVVMS